MEILSVVLFIGFIGISGYCLYVNYLWWRHCNNLNNEWAEHCKEINDEWEKFCTSLVNDLKE